MSYRRAWLLVDTMNRCFREPVVASATGGSGGGGAQVTALRPPRARALPRHAGSASTAPSIPSSSASPTLLK